jgi:F-type H+-transporting ATPase subunit gamma
MANAREIKNRIKSVQDTKKITTAMYMISSTRLRKAKGQLDATRPYFTSLKTAITRLVEHAPETDSIYFGKGDYNDDGIMRRGYLVITADKGLAGSYNSSVLKEVHHELDTLPGDWELYMVGEVGRQYMAAHGLAIEENFRYTAQNPTIDRAREITAVLKERYDSKALDEIYIAYTDMESSISSTAKFYRLLPMDKKRFEREEKITVDETGFGEGCEFLPGLEELMNTLVGSMMTGYVYSALVDSYCAEQNARMMAMDAANRNAEEMLGELAIRYQRTRQAAITQEITEVAAGARAQQNHS